MKSNGRIWPAALVPVLITALALLVSSPAEAKKKGKPPPPARWAITIPECGATEEDDCLLPDDSLGPCNLCGGIEETYYEDSADEDGLGIRVSSGQEQDSINSRFAFAIYRCLPGELCYPDEKQPPPVYLKDILLGEFSSNTPEVDCEFPGTTVLDTEIEQCRDLDPPGCMECFLNGPHPYWVTESPEEDYRSFIFELTVFNYDYESGSDLVNGDAYLSIEVYNTDDTLMPPDQWPDNWDDHNIFGANTVDPAEVTITADSDSWTVDVTVTEPMLFREWYTGCARSPNPKGKCPTEYKFPLDARNSNSPLAFQVTWARIPSED